MFFSQRTYVHGSMNICSLPHEHMFVKCFGEFQQNNQHTVSHALIASFITLLHFLIFTFSFDDDLLPIHDVDTLLHFYLLACNIVDTFRLLACRNIVDLRWNDQHFELNVVN